MNYEAILTLIGAITALVYGVTRMLDVYQRIQAGRYGAALRCLEAGVEQTYQVYVKAIKDASADGTLTDDERAKAREMSVAYAVEYGRTKGLDVVKTLGAEYLDVAIARIVNAAKDPSTVVVDTPTPAAPVSLTGTVAQSGIATLGK